MGRFGGIGRWLLLAILLGALAGCGSGRSYAPVYERAPRANASHYVVHRGDTLYHIARYFRLDYRKLAAWNGIRSPYTIYPGQRLRLTAPPARKTVARRPSSSPKAVSPRPAPKPAPIPAASSLGWRWPAEGTVAKSFSMGKAPHKGIDIRGRAGQPVRAAAAGKVVYSGDGLSGYRRLIIIKHNDTYLSAYGHNRKVLVQEGDTVKRGQVIAEMGRNSSGDPVLHFEVRQRGTPIDPARVLPKR